MSEQKINKTVIGCAALLIFFRFFYHFPAEMIRFVVLSAIAVLMTVFDGIPVLVTCAKRKIFGARQAGFAALYILQITALVCVFWTGFGVPSTVLLLVFAAVLGVWQHCVLTKKAEG